MGWLEDILNPFPARDLFKGPGGNSTPVPSTSPRPVGNFFDSQDYQKANQMFQPQSAEQLQQNPLISELNKMQQQAGQRAANTVNARMYNTGFGRSTFAPMFSAQAGMQAQQPYISQIAQTGENINQQNAQKMMQMLGLSNQYRGQDIQNQQFQETMAWNKLLQQKQEDEAKRKRENDLWNNLLYGGAAALMMTNPVTAPFAAAPMTQMKR